MIAVLGIEVIGDDARDRQRRRAMSGTTDKIAFRRAMQSGHFAEMMRDAIRNENRPVGWVARIVGRDAKYGLAREFLRGSVSFRDVKDELGARGVFRWYELEDGALFEVNAPLSWTSADRYFCRPERGRVVRMTRKEIDSAIAARTMVEIATVLL